METSEDVDTYILCSMRHIDNYILTNKYKQAFGLLILFLERLNSTEKTEVITYYSKNMKQLGIFNTSQVNTGILHTNI